MSIANGDHPGRYAITRHLSSTHNSGIESGRSYHVDTKGNRFLLVCPAEDGPLRAPSASR